MILIAILPEIFKYYKYRLNCKELINIGFSRGYVRWVMNLKHSYLYSVLIIIKLIV
jgi:hypothetical protein